MGEKGNETPGDKALLAMKNLEQDLIFKKPEVPRKKMKHKIMDEDSYIEVFII